MGVGGGTGGPLLGLGRFTECGLTDGLAPIRR